MKLRILLLLAVIICIIMFFLMTGKDVYSFSPSDYEDDPELKSLIVRLRGAPWLELDSSIFEEIALTGNPRAVPILMAAAETKTKKLSYYRKIFCENFADISGVGDFPARALQVWHGLLNSRTDIEQYDSMMHYAAINALNLQQDRRSVPVLLRALHGKDTELRSIALNNLPEDEGVFLSIIGQNDRDLSPSIILHLPYIRFSKSPRPMRPFLDDLKTPIGMRKYALRRLAAFPEEDAVPQLIAHCSFPEIETRELALSALAASGDPRSLPIMLNALSSVSENERRSAVSGLSYFDLKDAVPRLLESLPKDDPAKFCQTIEVLGLTGYLRCVPELRAAMSSTDASVAAEAIDALANVGDRNSIPVLIELLSKPEGDTDISFGGIPVPVLRVKEQLKEQLFDDQQTLRIAAIRALGKFADRRAEPVLLKSARSVDPWVRNMAFAALVDLRSPDVLALLLKEMKELSNERLPGNMDNDDELKSIVGLLGDLRNPGAIPYLLPLLKNENDDLSLPTFGALLKIGSEQTIPVLREYLEKTDWRCEFDCIRMIAWEPKASWAVESLGGKLAKYCNSDFQTHCLALCEALGSIGTPEAQKHLREFSSREKRPRLRAHAERMLAEALNREPCDEDSMRLLGSTNLLKALATGNASERRSAAKGLARYRTLQVFAALMKALDDPSRAVRFAALRSLSEHYPANSSPVLRKRALAMLKGEALYIYEAETLFLCLNECDLPGNDSLGRDPAFDYAFIDYMSSAMDSYEISETTVRFASSKDKMLRLSALVNFLNYCNESSQISRLAKRNILPQDGDSPESIAKIRKETPQMAEALERALTSPDKVIQRHLVASWSAYDDNFVLRLAEKAPELCRIRVRHAPNMSPETLKKLANSPDKGIAVLAKMLMTSEELGPNHTKEQKLELCLKDIEKDDRLACLNAILGLARINVESARPALRKKLKSPDRIISCAALHALFVMKLTEEDVPLFVQMLSSPDRLKRSLAAETLLASQYLKPDVFEKILGMKEFSLGRNSFYNIVRASLNFDGTGNEEVLRKFINSLPKSLQYKFISNFAQWGDLNSNGFYMPFLEDVLERYSAEPESLFCLAALEALADQKNQQSRRLVDKFLKAHGSPALREQIEERILETERGIGE